MSSPRDTSGKEPPRASAATRLSSWAANLLASGLILVAGLALGRQVLEWWTPRTPVADAASVGVLSSADLGGPERPHVLEIGELPFALRREPFSGDKKQALAALRAQGVEAVSRPVDLQSEPGPAERRMLSHIGRVRPTLAEQGRWELYELEGPILLVAGVRLTATPTAVIRPPEAFGRRVVFWGVGIPAAVEESKQPSAWSLFSYSASSSAIASQSGASEIPLPPGAHRTLSLATVDGGRVVAFRGVADSGAWRRHFEERLPANGWSRRGDWKTAGGKAQAQFEKKEFSAHIQWGTAVREELSGVVTVAPNP